MMNNNDYSLFVCFLSNTGDPTNKKPLPVIFFNTQHIRYYRIFFAEACADS